MVFRIPRATVCAVFLTLLQCAHSEGLKWWEKLFPNPVCPQAIIESLYQQGMDQFYSTPRRFRSQIQNLEQTYGADPLLLRVWFSRINQNPEIVSLMRGLDVPRTGKQGWRLSGGWGQDHLLVEAPALWKRVQENLPEIGERYHSRIKLPWSVIYSLLRDDRISMGDSAWLLFHPTDRQPLQKKLDRAASLKVTYFDVHSTPDGLFPRYLLERFDGGWSRLIHSPAELTEREVEMRQDGYLTLCSSLGEWGLLPLERERGDTGAYLWRIPEHTGLNLQSPIEFQAFSDPFRTRHSVLMHVLVDPKKTPKERSDALTTLLRFRSDLIPLRALRVGELGRLNIPPEANPGARAHLSFGLLVLLKVRPIEILYAEAPKVGHDLQRAEYEALTFKVVGETERGYKMRTTTPELEGALLQYLETPDASVQLTQEEKSILNTLFYDRPIWRPDAKAVW